MNYLFRGQSWSAVADQQTKLAIDEVQRLDRKTLLDPGLAGVLREIVARQLLHVPTIDASGKTGTRRDEQYQSKDYQQSITKTRSVLDVTIPFSGDPTGFQIHPSSHTLIDIPVTIYANALKVTFAGGGDIQREVDNFIALAMATLETLRREVGAFEAQLLKTLQQVADERIQRARADQEQDSKLNFPVRN